MAETTSAPPMSTWNRVFDALANPKFDFRTVTGISRETGLEAHEVQDLLDKHKKEVRVAYYTDSKGRLLYTLRTRPLNIKDMLSTVKIIASSTSSST